jgi:hypothetical protein
MKFEMHMKQLPFCISIEVEMCFSEIRICMCLWESRGAKNVLSLILELFVGLDVGGYVHV